MSSENHHVGVHDDLGSETFLCCESHLDHLRHTRMYLLIYLTLFDRAGQEHGSRNDQERKTLLRKAVGGAANPTAAAEFQESG